jgi:hypothetical protein
MRHGSSWRLFGLLMLAGRLAVVASPSAAQSPLSPASPLPHPPTPPQTPATKVAKFRPPLAERCANKDDSRGLLDGSAELWGIRLPGGIRRAVPQPLFQQVSRSTVQLADGRTVKVTLRGARLIPEEATTAPEPKATAAEASLVGAIVTASAPGGASLEITICDAEPDPNDASLWHYNLQYYNVAAKRWQNVCGEAPDKPAPRAIALASVWDESGARREVADAFSFACPRSVLARCVDWGYKPWQTHKEQPLTDYHQACTRMVRADYCGNGKSHARAGQSLEIYDELGIKSADAKSPQPFEAAWTPDGAYCVNRLRPGNPVSSLLKECPGRFIAEPTLGLGDGETCQLRGIKPAHGLIHNRLIAKKR